MNQIGRFLLVMSLVGAVAVGATAMADKPASSVCDVVRRTAGLSAPTETHESTAVEANSADGPSGEGVVCTWRDLRRKVIAHVITFATPADALAWMQNDRYRAADSPSLRIGDDSFAAEISEDIDTAVVAEGRFVLSVDALGFANEGPRTARQVVEQLHDALAAGWRPPATAPDSAAPDVAVQRVGPGEYAFEFDHPSWGRVLITTRQNSIDGLGPGPATLIVTDESGAVRYRYENEFLYLFAPVGTSEDMISPADTVMSPVDQLGHIFLHFDPGRYNGVIVLEATEDGFEDFESMPPPDDYQTRFYCARAMDVDGDGVYEINSPPLCGGVASDAPDVTYRWNGTGYEPSE